MRRIIIASATLFLAQIGVAAAAGPFDGNGSGEVVGGPSKSCTGTVAGTVTNNVLKGTLTIDGAERLLQSVPDNDEAVVEKKIV
jgi:hypothetical protein